MAKKFNMLLAGVVLVGGAVGIALLVKHEKKQDAALKKVVAAHGPVMTMQAGQMRPQNLSGETEHVHTDAAMMGDVTMLPSVTASGQVATPNSHITGATNATWSTYEPSLNKDAPRANCGPIAPVCHKPVVACPVKEIVSFQEAATGAGMTYSSFGSSHMSATRDVAPDARHSMQLDKLMPASWRSGSEQACAGDDWSKHVPTKEAFSNYITASGSSRLAMNDRSVIPSRLVGADYSGRPKPAVPVCSSNIGFGDSAFRRDLAAAATGTYSTF